jgi:hypothetical protein
MTRVQQRTRANLSEPGRTEFQPELIRTFATPRAPVELPHWQVAQQQTFGAAVSLAIGSKTLEAVARAIGMGKSQLCEITKNRKHFPMGKARDFAYYVGNWGLQQWIAHDAGFRLVVRPESPDEELARLRAQVAELSHVA